MSALKTWNEPRTRPAACTPPEFLRAVKKRLGIRSFAIDLAASKDNAVAHPYYSEANSAFMHRWVTKNAEWGWLNPPYDSVDGLQPWVKNAALASARLAVLVPAYVGTTWWREWVHGKARVFFLYPALRSRVITDSIFPRDLALILYDGLARPRQASYTMWNWRE